MGMRGKSRFFYGWTVVATAAVGLFFSEAPMVVYSFAVFLKPLAENFHAGRGAVSMAFTIHNVVGACIAPFIGRLVDRYGARKVILPGQVLLALVVIAALLIGSRLWQLYLFYVALGFVGAPTGPVPYSAVIARWFDRRRGLALGLIMFGMGIGTTLMPPLVQRLIAAFGWRMTFACLGAAILLIAIVVVALFLEDGPETRGLSPDGDAWLAQHAASAPGLEWSAVWRTRAFWLLMSSFMLAGASAHACVLHIAPLLSDRGLTAQSAALGSAVVGLAVMIGRIGSGYLQDRFFAPRVASGIFALAAIGMLILWTGRGAASALTAAFFVGLAMGAEIDIVAFLMSRYFGLRSLGTCVAVGFGGFILAGGIGVFLMGAGFDATGSYALPLAGFFTAMVLAAVLMTGLGPYRFAVMALHDPEPVKAGAA